jgi:N-acetyl-anhydromuramyl-L-alanine amidase AmpD
MNIIQVPFSNYKNEVTEKKQIYLHHTAGSGNGEDVFRYWQKDPTPVATCVAISRDGKIVQGFSSKCWAYHLGLADKHFKPHGVPYQNLDKVSIGVELVAWGFLREQGGKYYNYVNREVPASEVDILETPYKNFRFFQKYTDEQIDSTIKLLKLWNERYGIPLDYHEDIWQVTPRALKGEAGVYTHNSVRADKIDVYPSKHLIEALKCL